MMKRIILATLTVFALGTNSAYAKWLYVTETVDKGQVIYADAGTERASGNMVKIWLLTDYKAKLKTSGGKFFRSQVTLEEFDCRDGSRRLHSLTSYSGGMATGHVVETFSYISDWSHSVPGSVVEEASQQACSVIK